MNKTLHTKALRVLIKKRQIYNKIAWKLRKKVLIFAPAFKKRNDSIAQSVEHITFNDGVLGSSPSRVTKGRVIYYLAFLFLRPRGETVDLPS